MLDGARPEAHNWRPAVQGHYGGHGDDRRTAGRPGAADRGRDGRPGRADGGPDRPPAGRRGRPSRGGGGLRALRSDGGGAPRTAGPARPGARAPRCPTGNAGSSLRNECRQAGKRGGRRGVHRTGVPRPARGLPGLQRRRDGLRRAARDGARLRLAALPGHAADRGAAPAGVRRGAGDGAAAGGRGGLGAAPGRAVLRLRVPRLRAGSLLVRRPHHGRHGHRLAGDGPRLPFPRAAGRPRSAPPGGPGRAGGRPGGGGRRAAGGDDRGRDGGGPQVTPRESRSPWASSATREGPWRSPLEGPGERGPGWPSAWAPREGDGYARGPAWPASVGAP